MTSVWEVVTTDNSYWHSNGISGINVWHTPIEAQIHFDRIKDQLKPGCGAFIRKVERAE
jgi:hypothetical protein